LIYIPSLLDEMSSSLDCSSSLGFTNHEMSSSLDYSSSLGFTYHEMSSSLDCSSSLGFTYHAVCSVEMKGTLDSSEVVLSLVKSICLPFLSG